MIVPVILSGGSGTRLWPLSRAMYPKQFIRFFDGECRSLLGATLARLGKKQSFSAPIVVCNNDHRFLVREEVARADLEPQAILLEPVARNTAAAVAAAEAARAPCGSAESRRRRRLLLLARRVRGSPASGVSTKAGLRQ